LIGSRPTVLAALVAVLSASVVLTACESTQDKAKKLQAAGAAAQEAQVSLTIAKPNEDVKVVSQTLLHDRYGDAIVLELRNESEQALVNVPILVDLTGPGGKTVAKNDIPGLDYSLNHVTALPPGETVTWVDDQLSASAAPKKAKVTVGQPEAPTPKGALPGIELSNPQIKSGTQGIQAHGTATNKSKIAQLKVPVYVVAEQGGTIVAAGRGVIKNLRVGRPADFNPFFIGDPKGADVTVSATPTTFH
jgi:hypothetical protein